MDGGRVAVLDVRTAGRTGCRRRLPEPAIGQLDAVGLGDHVVVAHFRMRLGAQHVGVDEREVGHVEEVLDDARAAGVHDDRLVVVLAHVRLVPLGEVVRQLGGRPAERHEDDAVALAHGEHLEVGVGWRRPAGHRRLEDALSAAVVPPAVVAAHECVAAQLTERERGATVRALVTGGAEAPVGGAPEHDRRVEQRQPEW